MIKKLRVTVDSQSYEVVVDVPEEAPAKPAPSPMPAASSAPSPLPSPAPTSALPSVSAKAGDIVSPLAGRVVAIGVKAGQQVKEGEHVLTLEAMKMNTFVFSPKSGKVKEIRTEVGEAVQEGQTLLALE